MKAFYSTPCYSTRCLDDLLLSVWQVTTGFHLLLISSVISAPSFSYHQLVSVPLTSSEGQILNSVSAEVILNHLTFMMEYCLVGTSGALVEVISLFILGYFSVCEHLFIWTAQVTSSLQPSGCATALTKITFWATSHFIKRKKTTHLYVSMM